MGNCCASSKKENEFNDDLNTLKAGEGYEEETETKESEAPVGGGGGKEPTLEERKK